MIRRNVTQADMTDTQRDILACWLIWHGVNLALAEQIEVTPDGYFIVDYHDQPWPQAITATLEPPHL